MDMIRAFVSKLGITLDSTAYSAGTYISGENIRFDNLGIRKIGGWEKLFDGDSDIIRGMYITNFQTYLRIFLFKNTQILQVDIVPQTNTIISVVNRTPPGWIIPGPNDPDYTFSVDQWTLYSSTPVLSVQSQLFFVPLQNSRDLGTLTESVVYYGDVNSSAPFQELIDSTTSSPVTTSGGLMVFESYLMVYGNEGIMKWSNFNDPTTWTETAFLPISATKLVAAKKNLNTILVWSLSQLLQVNFEPGNGTIPPSFTYSVRCPSITIMSAQSIVQANNNLFYWIGMNTFYVYSGQLNFLKNDFNKNYFFKNVNRNEAGKIFGIYIENFNEIWWSFPEKESTECNKINLLNLEMGTWNINTIGRSCGQVTSLLKTPLLASSQPSILDSSRFPIYAHETGWDIVEDNQTFPLTASFQTHMSALFDENNEANYMTRVRRIEFDMDLEGDVTVEILNYPYPKGQPILMGTYTYDNSMGMLPVDIQARYLSIKVTSNTLGGYFQTGKHMINFQYGNVRPSVGQS
jgi:hypothetical protein